MGLLTFFPTDHTKSQPPHNKPMSSISSSSSSSASKRRRSAASNKKPQPQPQMGNPPKPSSWDQFKNLLSCKQIDPTPRVHDPSKKPASMTRRSSCRSICSFRDVVHGNTRVVHRADHSPEPGRDDNRRLTRKPAYGSSRRSLPTSLSGTGTFSVATASTTSSRGMQFRKLSGCYECHMIVDPCRYPITPRSTVCACPQCGEIFPKIESLEHHQAIRHAVSDLGPEDSGRNIVEIIFKSSWMKKENPICKIERILKVHNTQRTIQRFEECRDAVKMRASANGAKKNARCAADGNELLRFQCTPLACALGSRGSSSLCADFPACGVCTAIRHGFQGSKGVRTTASSGRAHDLLECSDGRRAMLVCRVIAGRIKRTPPSETEDEPFSAAVETAAAPNSYDSVAASSGLYSNLEDLVVFNPRAILPCFVVIYKTLNIT